MKTILLHGLGQNAHDWKNVTDYISNMDFDCPSLFPTTKDIVSYSEMMRSLETRYANENEPLCICGLSLGAILALDYTIRHGNKVASLVLIACQYKVPSMLIDLQNILFRCMPDKSFQSIGLSKSSMIELTRSMRSLDFSGKLGEISCPVVVACGEKDGANMKAAKKLSALLPQSELLIIPGVGHEVNKYAPEAIAAILNRG
jgi:pimeloyl-ACP methyl ester carboxylesterase